MAGFSATNQNTSCSHDYLYTNIYHQIFGNIQVEQDIMEETRPGRMGISNVHQWNLEVRRVSVRPTRL